MARPKTRPAQLNPVGGDADSGVRGRLGGVSKTMVHRLIDEGELEAVHVGRRVMITESSLEDFIERNRVAAS